MRRLIVANYKMNGDKKLFASIIKKINKLKVMDTKIVLCPPFVYLDEFKIKNKFVSLGCQDITNQDNSKSTGQISPKMLAEFQVKYVIVGHSERRKLGETDAQINEKVKICLNNGLLPIICVGEEKKSDKLDLVLCQVERALENTSKDNTPIIAYEPVWAIGTGKIPEPSRIDRMSEKIRAKIKDLGYQNCIVLYGGSVNKDNFSEIARSKIDGLLLGGVSLKIDEFIAIVKGIDNE